MKCAACSKVAVAKGYCHLHYNRWRRHGDPNQARRMCRRGSSIEDRLAELLDRSGGPDACWPFTGAVNKSGYGWVQIAGTSKGLHVWAYEAENGPVPDGLIVRHRCDNRRCANPAHLVVGTHRDNMADKVERGRQSRFPGESSPTAVLTESQALAIRGRRRAGARAADLAAEFGVSASLVYAIAAGKRWAHLEGLAA